MADYATFLARKVSKVDQPGRDISLAEVNPILHPWQAELVRWAVRTSRAALWADTGTGKTFMQLEWLRLTGGVGLVVAPLAVCAQTVREAAKLGITARYIRSSEEIGGPGLLYVTNYEMVPHIDASRINAVALDESSILKNSTGATRTMLIERFVEVPHRLACSATPAPNDPEELTSQAEFLGRMSRTHMLAAYFIHDSDGWRLKHHGREPMFEWMTQWAVAIRKPSDVGGDDTGYDLPGLDIRSHLIPVPFVPDDQLFATEIGGVTGRAEVRRKTLAARVGRTAELVAAEPDEPWLLWCGLNDEAAELAKLIPGAVNVHGSLDPDEKARLLLGFADGDFRVLITKPQIASQGLNYQHCARMAFVGLSDSYESYYQAIRRCYRYGQTRVVQAHIVLSDLESQIADNVKSKERQSSDVTDGLIRMMQKKRTAA